MNETTEVDPIGPTAAMRRLMDVERKQEAREARWKAEQGRLKKLQTRKRKKKRDSERARRRQARRKR